jgi:predicted RNA-binding Zn-ribbon protein involved in translation (DUF1610 family)
MEGRNVETIGVRRTGWAALDRDPQQDKVEFVCPYCGRFIILRTAFCRICKAK